MKMLKKKKL